MDNFIEVESIPTFAKDDLAGRPERHPAGQRRLAPNLRLGVQWPYAFGDAIAPWPTGLGCRQLHLLEIAVEQPGHQLSSDAVIPGVALNAYTGTLYYERYGFSARFSYSWRSNSINDSVVGSTFSIPDAAAERWRLYRASIRGGVRTAGRAIGYDFNSHVGVLVSVQNLTNSEQHTYLQWPDLPFTYDDWGKRYFVGIKGKL